MSRIATRITTSAPKNYGMYAKAAGLPDQHELIHLELGQPAHDTPEHIKAATIAAIEAGHVHYSELPGIAPLRAGRGGAAAILEFPEGPRQRHYYARRAAAAIHRILRGPYWAVSVREVGGS